MNQTGGDFRISEALKKRDLKRPIGMLNQLKFRQTALYPPDSVEVSCSGAEAYERYRAALNPVIERLGVTVLLKASVWFVGDPAEWDQTFVVHYPSANALLDLIAEPVAHANSHHRTAALSQFRLLMMDFEGDLVPTVYPVIKLANSTP